MVSDTFVNKFANAIATAEGFFARDATPNVPQRANNPGNLTDDGDIGYGTIQTSGPMGAKITIYPSVEAGLQALCRKLRRMLNGASMTYPRTFTIEQLAMKYSGDPNWATNVARELGVSTSTTLMQLSTENPGNPIIG